MATRGPKKGWKKLLESDQPQGETLVVESVLTTEQRNNPKYLSGEDLRALAWSLGMAKSETSRMDDNKIREQLKYLTFRRYHNAME